MKTSSSLSIPKLREDLNGRAIAPDDDGYDGAGALRNAAPPQDR